MRTITNLQNRLLASGNYARHVRVSVMDSADAWQDLSDFNGFDWLMSALVGAQIDQPVGNATVELVRSRGKLSLATLNEFSKLNQVSAAYSPLITPGAEIKIEVALTRPLEVPESGDWINIFEGEIDTVAWDSDPVVAQCRDKAGTIQRAFIEWEWVLGEGGHHAPIWIWEPNTTVVTARDGMVYYVIPPTPNGYIYVTDTHGTTGATEPAWRTDATAFSDGTHKWVKAYAYDAAGDHMHGVISHILNYPNADEDFSGLLSGSNFDWHIKPYRQQRQSALDACLAIAQMIGWDLRMKWVASTTNAWKLVLYEPARDNTTAARTFGPSTYKNITQLNLGRDGIRNVVRVVYTDSAAAMTNGVDFPRKIVQVEDSASIAKYGRAFCEIAESSASQIDTSAEATDLANAVLSDLSEPAADQAVVMGLFPHVELGDLYAFSPNGVHYDVEQKLAVVSYQHQITKDGKAQTTLQCRGKPSGGFLSWHKRMARPGLGEANRNLPPQAPTSVTVTNPTGLKVSIVTMVPPSSRWSDAELYISASNNFTPGSGNLEARGRVTSWVVPRAAGTYYGRIIIRDEYGNASQPSAQFTLAPT